MVTAPIVAQLSPTPVPSERAMLAQRIDSLIDTTHRQTGGDLGVVIWDLETDVLFERNADRAFPLASLFKLSIALTAYEEADRGTLDIARPVAIAPSDLRPYASRITQEYVKGPRSFTIAELIDRMLAESDNTAADVLYRIVGGADTINTALHDAGIDGMLIRTNEAGLADDAKAGRSFALGGDNAGSPAAVALLLRQLADGEILSDGSRRAFLGSLLRSQFKGRLLAGLPPHTSLAHKTGTSAAFNGVVDATNDAGIAQINGRNVVIVAMLTHAKGTAGELDAVLAEVARAAYDAGAQVTP